MCAIHLCTVFFTSDYISLEMPSHIWATVVLADVKQPLELHIPCREPLGHLMSQCNHRHRTFNCEETRLTDAVRRCMIEPNRFSKTLWSNNENITLKCFNPIPIEPYINYMSQILQPRRIQGRHNHRDTNKPRNTTKECIWNRSESFKDEVRDIMMRISPYNQFCNKCMKSKDDLLYS